MAHPLVVGLVATPDAWRGALEFFVTDHVAGIDLIVVHEPADAFDSIDVLVVDDRVPLFSSADVAALRAHGVRVIGVYDPKGRTGRGKRALDMLGVETAIPVDAPTEELVDTIAVLAPHRRLNGSAPRTKPAHPVPSLTARGVTVAVAGGRDSPGRTHVSIGLTRELAGRGDGAAVLLDLDEWGPSVARRLGYSLTPNVVDALAAVNHRVGLSSALAYRDPNARGEIVFDTIVGLPNPADWNQLVDVPTLLTETALTWSYVVIDTGPTCAPDRVPPHGQRHAATRATLTMADEVIAVCNGTREGVLSLFDWMTSAVDLLGQQPITVAINRAPPSKFQRSQLESYLLSVVPDGLVGRVRTLPFDKRVMWGDWDGSIQTRGPFAKAIARLAGTIGRRHLMTAGSPPTRRASVR